MFLSIACDSDTLPTLKDPSGKTYSTLTLSIRSGQINKLPANYFSSSSVQQFDHLVLSGTGGGSVSNVQQFDAQAFTGVNASRITFYGIDGLIPPPASMSVLQKTALNAIIFNDFHDPSALTTNVFDGYALSRLEFTNCPISSIANDAFSGLAPILTMLTLQQVGLSAYPGAQIQNLAALTFLDLRYNKLSSIPPNSFTSFPALNSLFLSGNPLAKDIEGGSLDSLPASLERIILDEVGFSAFPTQFLAKHAKIQWLSLQRNSIAGLDTKSLPAGNGLFLLYFDGNPLAAIAPSTLQSAASLQQLSFDNTKLSEVDFALFSDLNVDDTHPRYVDINKISTLKKISASAVSKYPKGITFRITSTGLETVDSSLETIFKTYTDTALDISHNDNLRCSDNGINWIAPYVYCTNQVSINGSACADKGTQSLDAYLKQAVPDPCGTVPAGAAHIGASLITILAAAALRKILAL